jgi:hypothetical protein
MGAGSAREDADRVALCIAAVGKSAGWDRDNLGDDLASGFRHPSQRILQFIGAGEVNRRAGLDPEVENLRWRKPLVRERGVDEVPERLPKIA